MTEFDEAKAIREIVDHLQAFAHATNAPPGVSVMAWFKNRVHAARKVAAVDSTLRLVSGDTP